MSFSQQLKDEIVANKAIRLRHKKAQAYGLMLFGKSFCADKISLSTEHTGVWELFEWFCKSIIGGAAEISIVEKKRAGGVVYNVHLPRPEQRLDLLAYFGHTGQLNIQNLATPEDIHAFISGVYLACGNLSDPNKSYHLELVCATQQLCNSLMPLLDSVIAGVKQTVRRGLFVLYYKECVQIEDLMAAMGASKCCFEMIEIEMIKDVRNRANRATNCETANIDKQVSAGFSQAQDIELIEREIGLKNLPEPLQQVAQLRLENPELSLKQLVEICIPTISRSGMHHRLHKLSTIANGLREDSHV